jgi:hypothetical protein
MSITEKQERGPRMFVRQMRLALIISAGVVAAGHAAPERGPENLALNKPYTLSPAPNYRHCTDPGDKTQLTDGAYSQGYFWTQKETVGWNNAAPVLCTLDLGRMEPIRGLSWNTAAGVAGVQWPTGLYALASEDRKTWTFLGDLCELGTAEGAPPQGKYATFRFATDRMKGRGRYVCVVAAARPFCFVDEIEVWRGPDGWLEGEMPGRRTDDPRRFYAEACVRSGVSARLREDLRTVAAQAEALGGAEAAAAVRAKAAPLEGLIDAEAEKAGDAFRTILPYGDLHAAILALNAPTLRAAGVAVPLIWQNNRWDPLSLTALPPRDAGSDGLALDLMRGEVRGETFNVTNPRDGSLDLSLTLSGLPAGARAELREVLFTDTQSRTPVAAALRRLEPDARGAARLTVPAGCTRQVWVSCVRPRAGAGTYRGALRVAASDSGFAKELAVNVRIRDLDFPERPSLHVGGWDYVQGRADYYKAPGNLGANLALMREMYVDSPWATPAVFPKGARFDESGRLLNADGLDFAVWDEWVARWRGARNYCVFFAVGDSFNGEPMGSPRFNAMVGSWLAAWIRHMERQGLKAGQLVILLVDEPHERSQDAVIVAWAAAVRAAAPGVTLFVDPIYTDPEKGDPAMFAANDVLCPNTPMLVAQGGPFRDFYLRQKEAGKTLWLYSCSGPAKLLDPVTYHRAQAWLAFQLGAEGSFFWAFGCGGGIGDSWRAYAQAHSEYSPYFVGPESVLEGKHSEAVRESVQDYEYLVMLRGKAAEVRAAGGDAAWLERAEALLSAGVAEAVAAVSPSNMYWNAAKDRSAMDAARVRILDLLETAQQQQKAK